MTSRGELTGYTLVIIAALSWSTAGLFTRVVSTDIATTLLWRSVFGGLAVMLIHYGLSRDKGLKDLFRFSTGEVIIAGVSAIAMTCFISAFFFTSIANVAFVYGAVPLVTMVLAWLLLHETPTSVGIIAAVGSAVGIGVLAWGGQSFSDFVGLGLALLMTIFMAAITVLAKYYPSANSSKCAYLSAYLAVFVVAPFSTGFAVSTLDFTWLALYGLVNVGLGFGVYLAGVSRIPALAAALLGLLEIPLAPVWAFMLFDEDLGLKTLFGGALVVIASLIYILGTARRRNS